MRLMAISFTFILIFSGCSSSKNVSQNYMKWTGGAESINANSENPLLDCTERPRFARLDKPYKDRIYIQENGKVCK